jgi:hypothetical protein
LVMRGANVSLYMLRKASQGEDFYIREQAFLASRSPGSKAFHSQQERVGFQRSSPQNNFRRIIACAVPPGNYCFDTVSYIPKSTSKLPLPLLLALLNSKLLDWYFRLGSTNSKVNEYQFDILPCPVLADMTSPRDEKLQAKAMTSLNAGDLSGAYEAVVASTEKPPFSPIVGQVIILAVEKITSIESSRGEILRSARSALDPAAQLYQDLIDGLIYRMAGLSDSDVQGLEKRLASML